MKEIAIVKNSRIGSVIVGEQTQMLLQQQVKLSELERETLLNESFQIMSKCTNTSKRSNYNTGLAIGYVQSGKTLSFTVMTALAKDNDYRIVIILAGTKNNLLYQTTARLKNDLQIDGVNGRAYKVLENPTEKDSLLIWRYLKQTQKPLIIITVLKHKSRIDKLANIFTTSEVFEVLGGGPVLVIDDEADQASLNTLARKNARNRSDEESPTFESIVALRSKLLNHTYLQYTATPQGPLLIDIMSNLSPDFHVILSPGLQYVGGKEFFVEYYNKCITQIPEDEVFHNSRNPLVRPPNSLLEALKDFYVGCAIHIVLLKSQSILSMMIHPDVRKESNRLFKSWVDDIVSCWIENFELDDNSSIKIEFLESFEERIGNSMNEYSLNHISKEDIFQAIYDCLLDTITHLVISGSDADNVIWSHGSCHILIGGPKLDRGFTVQGLMTTYMPRYTIGLSNADTIQQRCRFFGYKMPYISSCRVFLPKETIAEYISYVEHEEHFRSILKDKDIEEFSRYFLMSSELRPTRQNILSSNLLRKSLTGAKQLNALFSIDSNSNLVKSMLALFDKESDISIFDYGTSDRCHRLIRVNIQDIIDFLLRFKVGTVQDIELKSLTIEYLLYHSDKNSLEYCNLIEMAYKRDEPRIRTLISHDKIGNIFAGRSTSGEDIYPGDRSIMRSDSLNIQIHSLIIDNEEYPELHRKSLYNLGFIYPRNLRLSFIGLSNE